MGAGNARRPASAVGAVAASVFFSGDARNALIGEEVSGGMRKTSTPRFRIARLPPPLLGSSARKSLNAEVRGYDPRLTVPHAALAHQERPANLRNGFSLSSTVGEQRFALSSRTHSPRAALSSTPSTNSSASRGRAHAAPRLRAELSRALAQEDASDSSPASPPTSPASMSTSMSRV